MMKLSRAGWTLVLLEVLVFAFAVRARLGDFPMTRDEGEFAYVAQRMGAGAVPYRDIDTQKGPLNYYLYRLAFACFGDSPGGLRFFAAIWALALLACFQRACRAWLERDESLLATAALAVLLCRPGMPTPTPEFFLLLPMVLLVWLLGGDKKLAPSDAALAGLLLGVGASIKLLAALVVLLLAPVISRRSARPKLGLRLFWAGFGAPLAGFAAYFWSAGALAAFVRGFGLYNWDSTSSVFGSTTPWVEFTGNLGVEGPLFALALAGIAFLYKSSGERRATVFAWLAASWFLIAGSRRFDPAYSLLMAPALACAAAFGLSGLRRALSAQARLGLPALALLQALFLLYHGPALAAARPQTAVDPIRVDSQILGSRIARITRPQDAVWICGSEPQILYYAGRRSATRRLSYYWIQTRYFDALERQDELWREVSAARPAAILFSRYPVSFPWVRNNSDFRSKVERMVKDGYALDGLVFRRGDDYHWFSLGRLAKGLNAEDASYLLFRRRP